MPFGFGTNFLSLNCFLNLESSLRRADGFLPLLFFISVVWSFQLKLKNFVSLWHKASFIKKQENNSMIFFVYLSM